MSFKNNARWAPLLVAVAIVLAFGYALADPNPETVARQSVSTAYFDTTVTFTATLGDSIPFGFLADKVVVKGRNGSADTLVVTMYRDGGTLSSGVRAGAKVVASAGVNVGAAGFTFECAQGFSGLKGVPTSTAGTNEIFEIIASATTKR